MRKVALFGPIQLNDCINMQGEQNLYSQDPKSDFIETPYLIFKLAETFLPVFNKNQNLILIYSYEYNTLIFTNYMI